MQTRIQPKMQTRIQPKMQTRIQPRMQADRYLEGGNWVLSKEMSNQ